MNGSLASDRPDDLDLYADWMWRELGFETTLLESQYDRVSAAMKQQLETSRFWTTLIDALPDLADRFYGRTTYLMRTADAPLVSVKPWASFWFKSYRRNVLDNPHWPESPDGGWWTPDRWHTTAKDVLRTRIVVRYLDAVVEVVQLLARLARRIGHRYEIDYEATDLGYYAAHVVIFRRFEVPARTFGTVRLVAPVEIQVTTEVKDVVQELLHKYYDEARRSAAFPYDPQSRWNYDSDEFRSSYLGHMAHYLEGIIMNLRTKPWH
jgi:ppGpp synthetase/RelA/SpoT-type nucleotidyltranferase